MRFGAGQLCASPSGPGKAIPRAFRGYRVAGRRRMREDCSMNPERQEKLARFRVSLSGEAPPARLGEPAEALWWAAKGDWDKAHQLVQDDDSREAAWVHAYLHRVEGDLANAGYWYRRAGRPETKAALDAEWAEIAAALLA
jgi:hypothetical protein